MTGRARSPRYAWTHQKARAAAARRHAETDPCVRCGKALGPMRPDLHYDHTDDGGAYLGFSHARCNTSAGGRKGNAKRHEPRRLPAW